jgi:hypothetical protein
VCRAIVSSNTVSLTAGALTTVSLTTGAWLVNWFRSHGAHQSRPPFPSHGTVLKGCLRRQSTCGEADYSAREHDCYRWQRSHRKPSLVCWCPATKNIPLRNFPAPRPGGRRPGRPGRLPRVRRPVQAPRS